MYLVIDPNVIISAVIKKGNISEIFSLNYIIKKFNFIAPNFLILELGNHTAEILEKTYFSEKIMKEELEFVLSQITYIPDEEFNNKFAEAKKILKGHEKDIPYLALALAFNCNILSGDKTFKSIVPDRVKTPK